MRRRRRGLISERAAGEGRADRGAQAADDGVGRIRGSQFAGAIVTLRGMPWRVQYKDESSTSVLAFRTPEGAIEAACSLIDGGHRVLSIGAADPEDTISEIEVARIYAIWAREKKPFG